MKRRKRNVRKEGRKLARDPQLLFRASKGVQEFGVVGERRNILILFLAALTRVFEDAMSVLVKGVTSSGKSNLVRKTLLLFPPKVVLVLASLSKKAPVHGKGSLQGRIIYLQEYRGASDAQYLLRLQQSEGETTHEYTTVKGSRRGTEIARRTGTPVVFTTTTAANVFEDDETRFLSIWVDDSPSQTLAIVKAEVNGRRTVKDLDLTVWHEVVRLLSKDVPQVRFPTWFSLVAAQLPVEQVRVRRDWLRFLTFCKAVAISRRFASGQGKAKEITVEFSDYCVAYTLLNPALASTVYAVHEQELAFATAVRKLNEQHGRPVTLQEVKNHLKWKKSLAYKYSKAARRHKLVACEPGTRKKNLKRLLPVAEVKAGFLPAPSLIFHANEEIGPIVHYFDPLTGEKKEFRRERTSMRKGKDSASKTEESRWMYWEAAD